MDRKRVVVNIAGFVIVLGAALAAGCSQSASTVAPKSELQLGDEKKFQDLAKKGYNFKEIQAIMKGEQPPPREKKKSSSPRR
jgi:hypothetical protein